MTAYHKPNLMRVACELSKMSNPERTANALVQALAAYAGKEPPAPLPEPKGRTTNERFNDLLNGCGDPRAVYTALLAFAEAGK